MTTPITLRERVSSWIFGHLLTGERGMRRFRLAGFAIVANVLSKALGFLVLIVSTRVALQQLGPERFGVWITIASIAILLGFMDFGVSNALIGRVAALSASQDSKASLARIVSGGLVTLSVIGLAVAALLLGIFAVAPLMALFKGITPEIAAEARLTAYAFCASFGLSLLSQGILKIYAGMQHGWIANLTTALGWLVSLVLILLAPRWHAPMWYYLFATYGVQQLVGLLLGFGLIRRGLVEHPRFLLLGAREIRRDALYRQGQMFFIIQIAFAIGWGANQFILSSMVGPAEAASFGVLQRLFMIVQVPLTIVNLPLWAMYADALAHEELHFIRTLLFRSMTSTLIFSLIGVSVLIVGQRLFLQILSGNQIDLSSLSVVLMGIWTVIEAFGMSYSMYLNGVGRVRPQAVTGIAHTIGSVPIKILSVHYYGLIGLVSAIIVSYVVFAVIPYLTVFRSECLDRIVID